MPIHTQPEVGRVPALDQVPYLLYLLWDLGREEREGSEPQGGEGAWVTEAGGVSYECVCVRTHTLVGIKGTGTLVVGWSMGSDS